MLHLNPEMEALVNEVARRAAVQAVNSTLLSIGIDTRDPLKAQEQFASVREMHRFFGSDDGKADLRHLRRWRESMEKMQSKGFVSAAGLMATIFVIAVWQVVKTKIGLE